MKYKEEQIIEAIALLEAFTTDHNPLIVKAQTLIERSFFHSPHLVIKERYHEDTYFDLSLRAIKALQESNLKTPQDLVAFCNAKGLEGLARLSKVGHKSYTEIKEFLFVICV
ncbi:DNA-directed RNA polymerase subunit alpha C-terminal domain-containing protein [Dyadobacter subterraneus]|uniref:RNA polymerase alpha subunit C-terminal domain-containing protein n=1 Tax=Dyadobacter subterraneus TaxID=2773304 RepID=A0ABR9W964_9BACT|nr:DNA-directed RNA polymerase subunit alpha C-terminal domain-containing protein [Dyadobacter subterraneus]MBE9462029.1 hypothetical protein [Dyadobacter subterraneus]